MIVVSPLNSPIDNQINKLNALGVCCASLRLCEEEVDLKQVSGKPSAGNSQLIFTHPEVAVNNSTFQHRMVMFTNL